VYHFLKGSVQIAIKMKKALYPCGKKLSLHNFKLARRITKESFQETNEKPHSCDIDRHKRRMVDREKIS